MAFDTYLGERITQILESKKVSFYSKKMMGGLVFMMNEKMLCGIHFDKKNNEDLVMARIGELATETALKRKGCHPMDFTGRPMKAYVFVNSDGFDLDDDLAYWIQLCIDFNPEAKASLKKKSKK